MTILIAQSQPCQKSCVSTCLAMLLDIPAEEAKNRWHDRYFGKEQLSLSTIFTELGIAYEIVDPLSREVPSVPGIYFLTVPSLNYEAGQHQILAEVFLNEEGETVWSIYDPQYHNEKWKYFSAAKVEGDKRCVVIKGYTIDCYIPIDEVWRWRKANKV